MPRSIFSVLIALLAILAAGCGTELKDPDQEKKYEGPFRETANVLTLYSDSARVMVRLQTPMQEDYENGDVVFPDGIDVEFLEKGEMVTSTLRANYGKQERNKDLYLVRGNVIVHNLQKQEKLETEELYWNKAKAQIYTDKFVKITTPEEILMGHGLEANQDFSNYRIKKVTGVFSLKE
ncbi:LPS export ABC transporter periplasmic protein LptC [Pontibacter sp. HSC-36F09]|uniref:LPS export ABC transporter periplasmic protein LptC n=1 Tax=Pontibacter sp. HSC-36F09 TaxID=2910966 RepID=UPI00209E40F8|nr:LPS export ABC transporter periplasmic protein LptC [Pontibacter sp. HSC-36F09]MCP2042934.1 LPS export ABC transporter protein LptC [Pontibacter sp. HSC-36F09]